MNKYIEGKTVAPYGDAITASAIKSKGAAPAKGLSSFAASLRSKRVAMLAAAVAIAVATGATAGVLGISGLLRPLTEVVEAAPTPGMVDETLALHIAITHVRTDLTALKANVEANSRSTNAQFARIAERLDRIDRAPAAAHREPTGSVTSPQPAGALTYLPQPRVIAGWVVRDVNQGAALIQGRRSGAIEVEPGDTIPGLGRVESIRIQDGRWVVVTSRGLIASPR